MRLLQQHVQQAPGRRVLDAGCAKGRFLKTLSPETYELHGIDFAESFVKVAKTNAPNAEITLGSVTDLPYADGSFDFVYCFEVLQHVPDLERALSELARVLAPEGRLLICDKNLYGLDPLTCLPNFMLKPWREHLGRWMYPREFPFKERWFSATGLAKGLARLFSSVEHQFLQQGRYGRARHIYRIFPFFSHDICWIAKK